MGLKTKVDLSNLKFKVNYNFKSVEIPVEIFSNIRTIYSLYVVRLKFF